MSRINKRGSLSERFRLWLNADDNPLDQSMRNEFADSNAPRGLTAEQFARHEAENENAANALREREQAQYQRMHQWASRNSLRWLRVGYAALAMLVCALMVFFLLETVVALPRFGKADNPYNNEVSERYIEKGVQETGAVNFVSGMILDYRAFDTFGESTVLFVAACAVMLLLKLGEHAPGHPSPAMLEAEYDDRHHEPKNDAIFQLTAKILVPVILLFGFYVILNGHLSPGGGFSGGAVMGAGIILYLNAFGFDKTERFFNFKVYRVITFTALMTYGGLKSYSFFMGANHLPNGIPLGVPGAILSSGLILPLNICVGLIVMCTMSAFYTLFRKGGL